jgi:hypothetical protein
VIKKREGRTEDAWTKMARQVAGRSNESGRDDKLDQPSIKRDITSMQGNLMLKYLPGRDQNLVKINK